MEYLRWILLVAGILFIVILYFVGKKNKQLNNTYDYGMDDNAPESNVDDFSDQWSNDRGDDDYDVGEVRIVARKDDKDFVEEEEVEPYLSDEIESDTEDIDETGQADSNADVIVLHILARPPDRLAGDKINSAAQANGLRFGDMNIFHRIDEGKSVFSMANMVEPGFFDPDSMHELVTPGLTIFMQKTTSNNNLVIFEDMLECAYHLSEMLDAQLCNRQRQPLNQSDAEQYRELATDFDK